MLDLGLEIRSPAAEVVVDVDHRHAGAQAAALEGADARRDREGARRQLLGVDEVPGADHVDDQQRRGMARGLVGKRGASGIDGHGRSR